MQIYLKDVCFGEGTLPFICFDGPFVVLDMTLFGIYDKEALTDLFLSGFRTYDHILSKTQSFKFEKIIFIKIKYYHGCQAVTIKALKGDFKHENKV